VNKRKMEAKKSKTKRIISIFLLTQMVFWIACAFFNLYTSNAGIVRKISVTAVMFLNAGIFLVLTFFVGKSKPLVFFITVGFLLINAAVIIAGGISGWDYVILAFIAVTLGVYLWFNVKKVYKKVKAKIQEKMDENPEIM